MRTISTDMLPSLEALLDSGPLIWLAIIEVRPGAAFYLANASEPIEHRGQTWTPWPLEFDGVIDDGDGNLRGVTLTLSNVGRVAMTHLERGEWIGRQVLIGLAAADQLDVELPLFFDFEIEQASATDQSVTLTLGQPSFFDRPFPPRKVSRDDGFPGIPGARS